VTLARDPGLVLWQHAVSVMCIATTDAAGRAALLSAGGAAAALEAGLVRLRTAPRAQHRPERARRERFCESIAAALRRLRDPSALEEREPPGDGPPPGLEGVPPLQRGPAACVACGEEAPPGRTLLQCSACRGPERWCGATCQRATWAAHKRECRQRTAAGAAPAGAPAAPGMAAGA
jgi:hypothetical protein